MFISEEEILDRLNSKENLLFEIESLLNSDSKPKEQEPSDKEVSEEEATRLLDQALNPDNWHGRKGRGKEKSYEERADIGVLATVTSTYEAAKMLDISTGQTATYRNGKTNHYDNHESPTLKKRLRNKLDEIGEASADRLLQIIGVVDDESIESLRGNALKATQVGTNLARIIEKVQDKGDAGDRTLTQFIIMQPTLAREEDYDVIDVT